MTIETTWKLSVSTVSPVVVGEDTYIDVITLVKWTCIAYDGPNSASQSGEKIIPLPRSPETYIPLATIRAQDEATRRATILAWAEIIDPGFVTAREAEVTATLGTRMAAPVTQNVDLL